MIRCGTPEMEDDDAKEREAAARHFGEVMDDVLELAALRSENARLREELVRTKNAQALGSSVLWAENTRLRSWLRALEHHSPESVRAALRGEGV